MLDGQSCCLVYRRPLLARPVADDPWVDKKLVLVDQVQPVQLGRQLAATEEHATGGGVLEPLDAIEQVPSNVVAVGPWESISLQRHHVLRLGFQLDRPFAYCRRHVQFAAGDCWPIALHHLVGDPTPKHRPGIIHKAGEESVGLVVGYTLMVVDAAVQGNVDAEGQYPHASSISHTMRRTLGRFQTIVELPLRVEIPR